MTRTPFDSFAKQYFEELLSPWGSVEINREVPGESRFVDVWFAPTSPHQNSRQEWGVLGQMTTIPCLLEPYRNPPKLSEIRSCLLKLLWVQADYQRQSRRGEEPLLEADLPQLWILAPTASESLLHGFGAVAKEGWTTGFYFLSSGLRTAIIALNQLPLTEETLWLRILGRGATQKQAITEVLARPTEDEQRTCILRLLAVWKITMETRAGVDTEEQELFMVLSQAFLEWEQQTEQRGLQQGLQQGIEQERSLILRLLHRRIGEIPGELRSQVQALSLPHLESLGEALLDFSTLADLDNWLQMHQPG